MPSPVEEPKYMAMSKKVYVSPRLIQRDVDESKRTLLINGTLSPGEALAVEVLHVIASLRTSLTNDDGLGAEVTEAVV